jgi:predicted DNA-binding transcriptional regulator AlpA
MKYKRLEAKMQPDETRADILTRKQAAEFMGVCQNTLDQLDIPRTRVRRRVFYKRDEIKKWIDDHTEKRRGKK